MDDEKYYQTVADELAGNQINQALWTKAIAKSMGDENKTKAIYIQLRVEQLIQDERRARLENSDPAGEGSSAEPAARNSGLSPAQWITAAVLIVVILFVVKKIVLPKLQGY
ncbi:MAG: hypothetical protein AB1705_16590 [Verrucomicrobiota bacterium]